LHKPENKYHRFGMHDHWSRTCRTLKYLTDLYQASLKQNTIETNFIHKDDFKGHNVYLDISDLFKNPNKTDDIFSGRMLEDD